MRALISAVIVVCELSAVLGDDRHTTPPMARPELHAAILSQFRFVPRPAGDPAPAPAWSTHASLADLPPPAFGDATALGSDAAPVVRMAPVIVRGDADFRTIDSALRAQAAQARAQRAASRLGIGTHALRLRKATLYLVTVFDIPIIVGVSW